ncbi:Twitching mobility protein [compost metagenome]
MLISVISQRLIPRAGKAGGRQCATEILVNTPAVANLIRTEKSHQIKSLMQTGRQQGMHTLDMSIREQLQQGLVDPAAAKAYLTEAMS